MRRYLVIIGGAAIAISAAIIIAADAYGYVREGDHYDLPVGCGPHVTTAIQSVYPNAMMANVQSWECVRTWEDRANPNGALCGGTYDYDMDDETWWEHVSADGFPAWEPTAVNGSTITIRKPHAAKLLTATQLAAHAPLFTNGCIKDDNGDNLAWGELFSFKISRQAREDGPYVDLHVFYITSESSAKAVAEQRLSKKARWPVVEPD
jgi:hypothetical protein